MWGSFVKTIAFAALSIVALSLLNSHYPEVGAWLDQALAKRFPGPYAFDGWPDWIQAFASSAALALSLLGLSAVQDPRALLNVQFGTRRYNAAGGSKEWQVDISARRNVADELHLHIFPKGAGNEILSFQIVHADGGIAPSARIDELCDGHLIIKRMPARSKMSLLLKLEKQDTLSAMAIKGRINTSSIYEKVVKRGRIGIRTPNLVAIAHNRLMLLLILFLTYTLMITVKLTWIGFAR